MSAPNAELAYAVLDLTKAFPESFDMAEWSSGFVDLAALMEPSCRTTACFAGWTVAQRGYKVDICGDVYEGDLLVSNEVEVTAAELLRIDLIQAHTLFFADPDRIDDLVYAIFGPRPAVTQ